MTEEALTFSELRKIEKKEKRQDELSELDNKFLLQVSEYLEMKESTDEREYRNAKRVFDKIIGLRQDKIVKNAKISVKTDVKSSELNLLPREVELFRKIKEVFESYDGDLKDIVDGEKDIDIDDVEDKEKEEEIDSDDLEDSEESYEDVKIISDVPEFMGTDLESYGPFEEGEEVEIPEENAEILVNRGNAEVIE